MSLLRAYSKQFSKSCLSVLGLLLLACLAGCGSEETSPQSSQTTAQSSQTASQPLQKRLGALDSQSLHDTAIELFALGISSDDPAAIIQATALFEEAVTANPEETAYWIDLADAYMLSDIPTQYPYAVDIYWMLLKEQDAPKDILLGRLSEAYYTLGNTQLAYDTAYERLKLASDKQVKTAAYSFAYMAVANRSINPAVKVLQEKAERQDNPAYILLVASLLQELTGDKNKAIELIDKALAEGAVGSPLMKVAEAERRRLSP